MDGRNRAAFVALTLSLLAALAVWVPAASAAPTTVGPYTVTDLGSAQAPDGQPFRTIVTVNAHGTVLTGNGAFLHSGFVQPSGVATSVSLHDVNASGLAVGNVSGSPQAAVTWQVGSATPVTQLDLSALLAGEPQGTVFTNTDARVIDSTGEIAGIANFKAPGNVFGGGGFFMHDASSTPTWVSDPGHPGVVGGGVIAAMNPSWEFVEGASAGYRIRRSDSSAAMVSGIAFISAPQLAADGTIVYGNNDYRADGTIVALSGETSSNSISDGDVAVGSATNSVIAAWDGAGALTDLGALSEQPLTGAYIGHSGVVLGVTQSLEMYLLTPKAPPPPVVNSTGDDAAIDNGASGCDTGKTVVIGGVTKPECTLRAAIAAVNSTDNGEAITFAGPTSAGRMLIAPDPALPPITAAGTTLDFSSEGAPVLLAGAAPSTTSVGLDIKASKVTVKGLYAANWGRAVLLEAPGHDTVIDSVLGNSPVVPNRNNTVGVEVRNSPADVIGATAAADRNVLARDSVAIYIAGAASTGTRVEGNVIGADAAGTTPDPGSVGVLVRDSSSTAIGGATSAPGTGAGNLINASNGSVVIVGVSQKATGTTVEGNLIGVERSGATSFKTTCATEINVIGSTLDTRIGGSGGARNVISGRCGSQVSVDSTVTSGTMILGNLIGTDVTGTKQLDVGEGSFGIRVEGASHTTIGQPGEGNTVVGFATAILSTSRSEKVDLTFPAPVAVPGSDATQKGATSTSVEGNVVQALDGGRKFTAQAGTVGIFVSGRGDLVRRNLVVGSAVGVEIKSATGPEQVDGNKLGVDETGLRALDNVIDVVVNKSPHAIVGTSSRPNIIYGHGIGVDVEDSADVTVRSNHIGVTATGDAAVEPHTGALPGGLADALASVKSARAGITIDQTSPSALIVSNTIGALPADGVRLTGSKDTELSGNHIGVGSNGRADVGNRAAGIRVHGTTAPILGATLVGTRMLTVSGAGNLIAHNEAAGIELVSVTHPRMLSNRLWDNRGGGLRVSASHPQTPDAPHLRSATNSGGRTNVVVDITDDNDGVLQIFRASSCGASPQGETLVSTEAITAGAKHNVRVKTEPVGADLVATYTVAAHGTSLYSRCEAVHATN